MVDNSRSTIIPTAIERMLRQCSNSIEPTLTFSAEEMAVDQAIYCQGVFRRGYFDDLTKKCIFLPAEQNKTLTGNIAIEDSFEVQH